MYLITDTTNKVLSLGDRSLQEGSGQVRVSLLDTERAARDNAQSTRDAAGADYLAAVQARTGATADDDLTAVDKATVDAQRALTGAQLAAKRAEGALAAGEAATFAAFSTADKAASDQFGGAGEVWWDGGAFKARQGVADPAVAQRATDLATLAAKAQTDPAFAALVRLLNLTQEATP